MGFLVSRPSCTVLQNVAATVACCSSGIITQPYTFWLIHIVSVYLLTSHSVFGRGGPLPGFRLFISLSISYTGPWCFVGLLFCSPLPVQPSLPAVVSFSLRLPGLLAQSPLAVKWLLVTASWTTRLGLWLGVPACV